ncbi:MAG TPA: glycoside hydrolase family 2 TIM barrel-domain containing protein [Puia sp.]|nr:glycoside hydrolase family 2 TIM barrel-domain containing protein [Puia sp.]
MKKNILGLVLIVSCLGHAFAQSKWQMQPFSVQTRWAVEVSPTNALKEYPRPQMVRNNWQNLNGLWQYTITEKNASFPTDFNGWILVPYPIESALSGVKKPLQPNENLWYKTTFAKPALKNDQRLFLHFGAVDYEATIYINGKDIGQHRGGYESFSFNITDELKKGDNEIVVRVWDPTDQGTNPHGKQVLNPKDIWYTASSGIWQTVWMEVVPSVYITGLTMQPDIDKGVLNLIVNIPSGEGYSVEAIADGKTIKGRPNQTLSLKVTNAHLWSPEDPYLYNLQVKLVKEGKLIDEVASYFGMRKIAIKKDEKGLDRIFLNNKYTYNLGTLDQGFWPDGLYTAPTDEALAFDIKAIKAMGFNTIRKHIKVEPARWYYYCDKLGMLVWQDMVNPSFNLNEEAKQEFEKECKATVEQLYNHPSIITWVLFNEKWGQYDQQRLTEWIKTLDPTRLVNGHTGEILYVNEKLRSPSPNAWVSSDMTDVHSYPDPMNAPGLQGKTRVLGEFGGIGVSIPDHQWNPLKGWGYIEVTPSALKTKYTIMNLHLRLLEREGLSASVYTQPFDVEGEQNGLMTYDREIIKIPFEELRKIHAPLVANLGAIPEVVATNADVTDPGIRYSQMLQEYIEGKRDDVFLKKMAIAAQQAGDKPGMRRSAEDYVSTLKAPFSKEELNYIMQITSSTKDPGFAILHADAASIDTVLGPRKAEVKLMNLIYGDEIEPFVNGQNVNPDWDELKNRTTVYGAPGEEIFLRAKTIYFLNHQDYIRYVQAGTEYISKYGQYITPEELNNFAWTAFKNVDDQVLLLKSVEWSKLSLQKEAQPAYMDTEANLLYKAGKKEEAIAVEERAVRVSGNNNELKETLEKMKRDEKTWVK